MFINVLIILAAMLAAGVLAHLATDRGMVLADKFKLINPVLAIGLGLLASLLSTVGSVVLIGMVVSGMVQEPVNTGFLLLGASLGALSFFLRAGMSFVGAICAS